MPTFPRPCPCELLECQQRWKQLTQNECCEYVDDLLMYHCCCHDIQIGHDMYVCECGQVICHACSEQNFVEGVTKDVTLCDKCTLAFWQTKLVKYKQNVKLLTSAIATKREKKIHRG